MNLASIAEVAVPLPMQFGQISMKIISSCFDLLVQIMACEQTLQTLEMSGGAQHRFFALGSARMKTVSSLLTVEMRLKEIQCGQQISMQQASIPCSTASYGELTKARPDFNIAAKCDP